MIESGDMLFQMLGQILPSSFMSKITEVCAPGFSGAGWKQLCGVGEGSVDLGVSFPEMELARKTNLGLSISSLAHHSAYSGTGISEVGNFLLFQVNSHGKGHPSDCILCGILR